jgi:hypothetical protein
LKKSRIKTGALQKIAANIILITKATNSAPIPWMFCPPEVTVLAAKRADIPVSNEKGARPSARLAKHWR